MTDFAALFLHQAEASAHVQFAYDPVAGRVAYVNPACEAVLGGTRAGVNAEWPGLLARLHPDDRPYLARCWQPWQQGRLVEEIELRLQDADAPDQTFCLTPTYLPAADGGPGSWAPCATSARPSATRPIPMPSTPARTPCWKSSPTT
ncbi:MAG TPA: PAS domain-containing protein [Hymenobacter sp.]|uniref:PAS domain-containing protein n=1 Tax=Hymenobacter sp. TaxID=1898978 RepID=UPI002EDA9061